jgi:putative Mg2+ transporter-C (MgtC) family protein
MLGRPLGHLIDRDNVVEEDEDDQPYQLQVICRPKSEKYARAQIVQRTGSGDFVLRGIHTGRAGDDSVALTAYLLSDGHAPSRLEKLVAELSLQPGVQAVHWYAGDQDDPMPRAPQPE